MDLVGVVNDSASMNVAQVTGREDGSVVTTYDWQLQLLHQVGRDEEAAPPSL